MRRTHIGLILTLIVAIPAGTAGIFYGLSGNGLGGTTATAKPCFIAGNTGYQFTSGQFSKDPARHTVRVDNDAASPHLRMQLVDDPAAADFVLVDDSDATIACKGVSMVQIINIDAAAERPDLIVSVSRAPADYKIYLHSENYTEQDAAALAAVIRQNASKTGTLRTVSR